MTGAIDRRARGRRGVGLTDTIARGGHAVFAEIDGEAVALDARKGACYGLNAVGARVWGLIEPPTTVARVCETLLTEFAIDPDTCAREVIALVNAMAAEGLLEIAARPPGA